MLQNRFRSHFVGLAKHAVERADALGKAGHAGLRGLLREVFVADLLEKVVPPDVVVGSGQLTSVAGRFSSQIDIILYSPSILIPAVFDGKNGFFPAECCLYNIEVKTKIDKRSLSRAIASAREVSTLPLVPTEIWLPSANGRGVSSIEYPTPYPVSAIFAFSSDLKSEPLHELARYRQLDNSADASPAIPVICIRGSGYWYFDRHWRFMPASADFDEIIWFLAGIANTLPQLIAAKGRLRLGRYITETSKQFVNV